VPHQNENEKHFIALAMKCQKIYTNKMHFIANAMKCQNKKCKCNALHCIGNEVPKKIMEMKCTSLPMQ